MVTLKDPITTSRPRSTLADQLDRLDRILDGLAEALTDAVGQAVREAVTTTLAGVNRPPERPAADDRRRPVFRAVVAVGRSFAVRVGRCLQRLASRVAGSGQRPGRLVAGRTARAAAAAWQRLRGALRPPRPSVFSAGLLLAASMAGAFAGPYPTGVGCGVVGATVLLSRWAPGRTGSRRADAPREGGGSDGRWRAAGGGERSPSDG